MSYDMSEEETNEALSDWDDATDVYEKAMANQTKHVLLKLEILHASKHRIQVSNKPVDTITYLAERADSQARDILRGFINAEVTSVLDELEKQQELLSRYVNHKDYDYIDLKAVPTEAIQSIRSRYE